MPNLSYVTIVPFALLAVACGEVAQPSAGGDDDMSMPDGQVMPGTATVLAVSPADGEAGVAADATITVTFSAPMDHTSVESAWQSTDLPASAVTFAWNAAGDTLTVTPTAPLELAEGTDPATVSPNAYSFSVASSAMTVDGGALATPLAVTFTTARRIRGELAAVGLLTRTVRGDGVVYGETAVTMTVGDTTSDLQTKTFVTFTLPSVPVDATLEAATLTGSQNSILGQPYGLGSLRAVHTSAATINAAAFAATPLAMIGDLSTDATTGSKQLEVTASLADDLANSQARGDRTQYRLEFPTSTNSNGIQDEARFSRSGFKLTFSYLLD